MSEMEPIINSCFCFITLCLTLYGLIRASRKDITGELTEKIKELTQDTKSNSNLNSTKIMDNANKIDERVTELDEKFDSHVNHNIEEITKLKSDVEYLKRDLSGKLDTILNYINKVS